MLKTRKALNIFLLLGVLTCQISLNESGTIKRAHRKRQLTQQQQLDEVLNQQLIQFEKFLLEQQTQLELAKQEQLRQLQEAQVKLFQQQQEQEVFIAKHQAQLNNEKIAQQNQNRPPGATVDELRNSMPVVAEDAALGGANSNTKRVQEHNLKIDQQLHHEETKKHLLEQQQLQIDAMNTQNQIQAETRADHQEAFITSKLEIENQLAAEREMLYAQIEAQRRERAERALKLQQLIDGVFEDEDEYDSVASADDAPQFARLMMGDERQKAFELKAAERAERQRLIQEERVLRRKEEQIRQAQKLQDILHDTQMNQEAYEQSYQKHLEDEKQQQMKQSKKIQDMLHQTQRQLEAQEENQYGVVVSEAKELAEQVGDQQTRNQKLIIQQHQERIRLAHKMQQNNRLTQDIMHDATNNDIKYQQAQQHEHMINQHQIQLVERLKQKEALETLRNQLKSQIYGMKKEPAQEPVTVTEQRPEVINPDTVYLEPRFFQNEAVENSGEKSLKDSLVLPESKTVTITTVEEKMSVKTQPEAVNKTVEISCSDKDDGMYRNENDCNSYYVCTKKQMYKFACPSGTSFSMEHCTCDWPTESTQCVVPLMDNKCSAGKAKEAETKTEVVPEQSDKPETWAPFSCSNKEKGFYRDPVDCSKFYYCEIFSKPAPLTGQTIIKNDFYCPDNFHFDVFTCKCGQATANSCSNYALTTYCTHSQNI